MTTTTEAQRKEEANKDATESINRVTVLYGDYDSGKTTTACGMINERGLVIGADESWKVLLNPRHEEIYSKVKKIVPYEGLSQLKYIDFSGYDTILWDTVSHSVDVFLDLLYDEATWGYKVREKIESKHPDLKGVEALGFADYRVTRDSFRPVLNRLFKETQAHIIFTSHMTEPIKGMGDQHQRPSIPAATFKIIGTRADLIAQCKRVNGKFVTDFTHNSIQLGKTRIEGIEGQMNRDAFTAKYRELVF